ncbi:MAG: hypothetical protein ABI680_20695 [Chthoniobacteraceae bacterium]
MNPEERNLALQNAVLEWQKKYGIRDGDPMLASLELFHIYLRTFEPSSSGSRSPTFEEFRESIELLDQRTKSFAKQAAELIQELRRFPAAARQGHGLSLLFMAALILAIGMAIGKFAL